MKAITRAGAGTNNVPIDMLSAKGIPVFNTPWANAAKALGMRVVGYDPQITIENALQLSSQAVLSPRN